ncbi:FtsK/SpoIIIE domain-containing protein [Protofrankia coriariae]|uniref:FtsK/SpoIIIE domain-containing protein n=1 Tax=Protofrankia coriariae TaxID=1562887 RepID=UPI00069C8160|nr:FtsK/SpoIIIE domain-containing protein [Protofrankia coriariae]
MEYEVTVVGPRGRVTPLLIEADATATVGELRTAVAELLAGHADTTAGRPGTARADTAEGGTAKAGIAGIGVANADSANTDMAGAAMAGGVLFIDGELVPAGRRLADIVMTAGTAFSFARPEDVRLPGKSVSRDIPAERSSAGNTPDPGREVAVVGGPVAGASAALAGEGHAGTLVLGRTAGCDLVLDDPEVSRRHAEIRTDRTGAVLLADTGSRNGVGWRGYRATADIRLRDGDVAQLGESMITVRPYAGADARLEADAAHGVRRFNRPPRIVPPRRRPEIAVPAEPEKPRGFRFPLVTVLLPLLFAAVLYALLPNAGYYLLFMLLSPVMAVAHAITERRGGHREYRQKLREYQAELDAVRTRLATAALEEEQAARDALPDPAMLVRYATGPTGRLFERRPTDEDFGRLRVGLTDRPVDVRLSGPGAENEELPTAYAVPVTVELTRAGVLGVAGPRKAVLPVTRALLAQVATLHAPHDFGIVLFTGQDEAADWEWVSWLPHTLPHRTDLACRRMVATDREQAEARIAELRRIMDERRADQHAGLRDQAPPGRRLLLLLDGAHRLRTLPGLADLLADGPGLGVYALCLDNTESSLPDECRATVVVTNDSGSRVRVTHPHRDAEAEVLVDGLRHSLAERVARALAPVRVLGARFGDDGDLPDHVRFLDICGLGADPGACDIAARWAAEPGGRSTRILLGADASGPVAVDLRRDGPHALIAGTSGAGKSELLQTLVASLALGNTPEALTMVLVDYKGGSAFADCRDLPHCVGMVTDLDGHLADRALASLSAELRRRETILAAAGAKEIEDYWAGGGSGLPRLVIVVDEFATLVEEVPRFVDGVVGIGMRGRSLGVHVVLATQRPAGVVNAEIRANVNLRLCLRVTRAEESADVIEAPDAARISRLHPGRAYLRTGHSELTAVQCARIGWPRPDTAAASSTGETVTVTRRRITDLGRPRRARTDRATAAPGVGHAGATDLTVVVAAVRAAAERMELRAPASPWLPPLPERITISDLDMMPAAPTPPVGSPVAVRLGLADHPARQAQEPFVIDLEQSGPLLVAGMARSGRSTLLRTLAASLATHASPADVHLYALDYGSRALAPLASLPHCGAWVTGDEPDRVDRLLDMLTTEVSRRTRLLAAGSHASLGEQRAAAAPADRLPYLTGCRTWSCWWTGTRRFWPGTPRPTADGWWRHWTDCSAAAPPPASCRCWPPTGPASPVALPARSPPVWCCARPSPTT